MNKPAPRAPLQVMRRMTGVALVTAIFLLVVLAGLVVAVVSLSTTQQTSSARDVLGARAYLAARAGIEWALYNGLRGNLANTPDVNLNCPQPASAANTFAMPAGTTLSTFSVTISCGTASSPGKHFLIRSTACNGPGPNGCPNLAPGPDYVQRMVEVQL